MMRHGRQDRDEPVELGLDGVDGWKTHAHCAAATPARRTVSAVQLSLGRYALMMDNVEFLGAIDVISRNGITTIE